MMLVINDQAWCADLLAYVLNSYCDLGWVHVNLIPLNEVPGSQFSRSREEDMDEFLRRLEAKGIATTMRDTRGDEIDAACGRLTATASHPPDGRDGAVGGTFKTPPPRHGNQLGTTSYLPIWTTYTLRRRSTEPPPAPPPPPQPPAPPHFL